MIVRLFRRVIPHPYLSLTLVMVWMLLANDILVGHLVTGIILGIALPLLTAPYWPDRPRIGRPFGLAIYVLIVLWDIVRANVAVARIVLFRRNRDIRSGFVTIPLDITTPEAIAILAGTITLTPGTVSADLSADGRALLVHALDMPDPEAVRDEIKTRYEARLKEIFA